MSGSDLDEGGIGVLLELIRGGMGSDQKDTRGIEARRGAGGVGQTGANRAGRGRSSRGFLA